MAQAKPTTDLAGFTESPQYEDFIGNFTEQLERWKRTDEPADQFARRMTGLLRMSHRKWAEKKR